MKWLVFMVFYLYNTPISFSIGREDRLTKAITPQSAVPKPTPVSSYHLHAVSRHCHQAMIRKTPAANNKISNSLRKIDTRL